MAGKILIDSELCKGCGLCVVVCPQRVISMSDRSNSKGLFPAFPERDTCTGCVACAVICPDAAIQVLRDGGKIVDLDPSREQDACLAKEKP